MGKLVIWVIVLVILLIGGYYAVKILNKSAMAPSPTPAVVQVSQAVSPTSMQSSERITVKATEYAFNPSTITVKKGQPVTIIFENMGQYSHNFTLMQLGVKTNTIQPGQKETITFTPQTSGSFTYICTVPGHADRGMKGTLIVE